MRIISNVSSHSNISVGAVTFRNIGEWGLVKARLVSDMAEARPPLGWKQNSSLPRWFKWILYLYWKQMETSEQRAVWLTTDKTSQLNIHLKIFFFDNVKTFSFFSAPNRLLFFFSSKNRNGLCKTPAVIIRELHWKSNLIFAVIGYTSLPSGRHVGKDKGSNSLHCAGCVGRTNGFLQKNCMRYRH